ncbi:hypothetical protein VPH35_130191 [Triticum aestivum]
MGRAQRDRRSSTSKPDAAVMNCYFHLDTSANLSQFDALTLNTTPCTLQSADRAQEHSTEVRSSEPGSTSADLSKVEGISLNVASPAHDEPTDGAVVHDSDTDIGAPDSTVAKQPAVQGALSQRSEETWREIDEYLAEHTFNDIWEALVAVKNGFCDPPKKVSYPNKQSSEKLALPDSQESPHRLDAQSFQTKIQCGESTEQITKNGKLWMEKEVMKAFKKCIIAGEGLRGMEFELDELLHQCFSVETYDKTFHHYNFTVRMKEAVSDKWSSTLYFAQAKEMYGRKFYFCYPLDPNEDGILYMPFTGKGHACKNQGMDALRHPAVPIGYETGRPDAGCPFLDDDSDDDGVADNDAFVRAFEQSSARDGVCNTRSIPLYKMYLFFDKISECKVCFF